MEHLPKSNKRFIQSSYMEFCELTKTIPEVKRLLVVYRFMAWGGAVAGISSLFNGLEQPVVIVSFLVSAVGWGFTSKYNKKYAKLINKRHEIWKGMRELGISIQESLNNRVIVFTGSAEKELSPLKDDDYK